MKRILLAAALLTLAGCSAPESAPALATRDVRVEPARPAASASLSEAPAPAVAGAEHDVYVVQAGDTLALIAGRYGTDVGTLAELNGIADPAVIYVGQSLRLPASAVAGAQPGAGAAGPPSASREP